LLVIPDIRQTRSLQDPDNMANSRNDGRLVTPSPTMRNYKPYFVAAIKSHYPQSYPEIASATDDHYKVISADSNFSFRSHNPIDRRLDFCAYFLALIKTLDHRGELYDTIRIVSLEIVTNYVTPRNGFERWLKKLPPKLVGTRLGNVLMGMLAKKFGTNENKDGFIAHIITDKKETYGLGYGVDIIECGICKLFDKHHFGKYAPILCEVDKVTSELAGLELIRSGTIANGAKKCDFRYKRVAKAESSFSPRSRSER
jgi:hypothetical protein